jgi:hypothetical protein
MYIAKTIVEKHGGHIKAENNKLKGAIIKFNINQYDSKTDGYTGLKMRMLFYTIINYICLSFFIEVNSFFY